MAEQKWVKLLTASVLPGGAELFWSTEKVTITEGLRRSLESGCFPVSKCISAAQSSLKVEILPGPNFVSVLSPIIYDEEIICFIKQNALREELEFLFCLKSRFSYERLTFWVLSLNQASCHPSRLSLTSRLKAVIAAHHHKERFAFNFQAITVAIFESAKPSWYRSTESRLLRHCFFFSPCDPDAVNPVCLPV